jgi:hypothetical protein
MAVVIRVAMATLPALPSVWYIRWDRDTMMCGSTFTPLPPQAHRVVWEEAVNSFEEGMSCREE